MFLKRGPEDLGGCNLALDGYGGGLGDCASTGLATCALSCPSPTGSSARRPGLVPGPLALAPGPAADGFLFLPVSLEQAPASPPPSSCLAPSNRHTVFLTQVFTWLREKGFPYHEGGVEGGSWEMTQIPDLAS